MSKLKVFDEEAVNYVYSKKDFFIKVTKLARDEESDDIFQRTVAKMFIKKVEYFSLDSFFGQALKNEWVNYIRTRRNARCKGLPDKGVNRTPIELKEFTFVETKTPDKILQRKQQVGIIMDCIDRMSARKKKAIELKYIDDIDGVDIAEIMNCSYDTAKANYRHGILELRSNINVMNNVELIDWESFV